MKINLSKFPTDTKERLKHLYRLQELLRLFLNEQGRKCNNGELRISEYKKFQNSWFRPRNIAIAIEINKCKHSIKEYTDNWKKDENEQEDIDEPYRQARTDTTIKISLNCFEAT